MKIIHTSPEKIEVITTKGLFDDCLFFSSDEYAMGKVKAVYELEIDERKIIEVCELFDEVIIADICMALDVNEEQAEGLLIGSDSVFDLGMEGEDDWYIQARQGECAKKMGFEAVKAQDEQGAVYIVPMLNRENDLVLVKEA